MREMYLLGLERRYALWNGNDNGLCGKNHKDKERAPVYLTRGKMKPRPPMMVGASSFVRIWQTIDPTSSRARPCGGSGATRRVGGRG